MVKIWAKANKKSEVGGQQDDRKQATAVKHKIIINMLS